MITIVTGDIRSGKTTLMQELYGGAQVGGIVAPGGQNDRIIVDRSTGTRRPLIATDKSELTIAVGRYHLDRSTIDWANRVLIAAVGDHTIGTIILDEVGKLELAGDGHASVVPVLREWSMVAGKELVVVVRSSLAAAVWERFFGGF